MGKFAGIRAAEGADTQGGQGLVPAFMLLVACADWPRNPQRNQLVSEAFTLLNGDWPAFLDIVRRHRMAALALDGLVNAGIEPPEELTRLALTQRKRSELQHEEGRRLIALLGDAGINGQILKGTILSQSLYDDPAMRFSIDIDLLVDWSDFETAHELLVREGYAINGSTPPWGRASMQLWRNVSKDLSLFHQKRGIKLELHHRLTTPASLLQGLEGADSGQNISVKGQNFPLFASQQLFTYLVVHESTQLWHRLKWLADLRALLVGQPVETITEWRLGAIKAGAGRCADLALILVHLLWAQPIPKPSQKAFRKDRHLARLVQKSLAVLTSRERDFSASKTDFAVARFRLRDDWAYRRQYLLCIFITVDLLQRVHLPKWLWPLYAPIRGATWLKRKFSSNWQSSH